MGSYTHDPLINYNANLLKQAGTEEYTAGRDLTAKAVGEMQPVYDYFKKALSGDTTQLMQNIQPEADVVGQQFNQVRQMISDQPRSGGKASTLAELPVEQIKVISNLLAQNRQAGAQGAAGIAGAEAQLGQSQSGQGLNAAANAANIAMGGRAQDIGKSFKANFLSSFGSNLGSNLADILV